MIIQSQQQAKTTGIMRTLGAGKEDLFRLALLKNDAGIAGVNVPVTDYPLATWNAVMNVNLNGIFHTCRAIVPYMQKSDYGRIVNISSIVGRISLPFMGIYSASKFALEAISDAQLQWFENVYRTSDADWVVVFFHHPPYSAGYTSGDPYIRSEVLPIIERHNKGNVIVVCGKIHDMNVYMKKAQETAMSVVVAELN